MHRTHSLGSNIIAAILANERILPKDLCEIVGMYVVVTDDDRIMFMLANRESPEIFIRDIAVVNDLDEFLGITYERKNDTWVSMTLIDRLASLSNRRFKSWVRCYCNCDVKTWTLKRLVNNMRECKGLIDDIDKKSNPYNIFAIWLKRESKTVLKLTLDWMSL